MPSRAVVAVCLVLVASGPFAADAAPRKQPRIGVSGTYDSNYGEVRLVQHGTLIEGEYVCCGGGTIHGRIDGRVIRYYWAEAERKSDGHGVWRVAGGELIGTWGSGASEDDGGEWNLTRIEQIAN
jgi:hypothetical protein